MEDLLFRTVGELVQLIDCRGTPERKVPGSFLSAKKQVRNAERHLPNNPHEKGDLS